MLIDHLLNNNNFEDNQNNTNITWIIKKLNKIKVKYYSGRGVTENSVL